MTKKLCTPQQTRNAYTIRAKLATLSLSGKDVAAAIAWVRKFAMRKQKIPSSKALPKVHK
jgi:hypothetical protein